MAAIDWRFMQPLDQTNQIAAMAAGNNQINSGLAAMGGAVTGYADALKQRNTDAILNALNQAQTSADLPNAMAAVNALQQQYGRGFDQAAVRNAIDTRGSTLGQRDLQAINLQQAQAAQAAIPQLNQMALAQAQARGVDTSQLQGMAGLGIDTTGQINSFANQMVNDSRDTRDFNYRSDKDTRDFNYRQQRDRVGDQQWNASNDRANMDSAYRYSEGFATPAQSGFVTNPDGTISTVSSGGVTRGQAFSGLMGSLFQTESGGRHTDSNGNLTRSPKGALGVAQIMPATAAKPGYGMKPINLQTSSADEQKAWATEYIGKIADKHNFTTEQAVAAYNAGPGAVEKAIAKAKDPQRNGGNTNWLSHLPAETRAYVPKVMGGAQQSQAQQASGAVRNISQASMAKITGGYSDAIAKLNADYQAQGAKDQVKGSIATTGKNIDTWAASKKDSGLIFSSNNSFFTKASDLAKMAKQDAQFNKLPENAQMNILEGAYAKMNDVNAFQYVPDGDLKKFISQESANYSKDRVNQFNQQKDAVFEQSYQSAVNEFRAQGMQPPSRDGFRQLVDPQSKPTTQAAKATQAVQPKKETASTSTRPPDYLKRTNSGAISAAHDNAKNVPARTYDSAIAEARKIQADNQASEKKKREAAEAVKRLSSGKQNQNLSPEMRKLLNQFGGGLLK